jgi:hypothetical protein
MGTWILLGILSFAAAVDADLDFWERSPTLWREFHDHRKIFVSAKNENGQTFSAGAGLVKSPLEKVWAFANDPEKIKKTTSLLEDFKWDKKTGLVELHLKLLTFRYIVRGVATVHPDPERPTIGLRVYEDGLVPFTAELEFRSPAAQLKHAKNLPIPAETTIVKISGVSSKDRALSWPLRVALEAVLQRMAGTLRHAVEEDAD